MAGNLDNIDNIVVLMLENRSFDNILGWLYPDNPDFWGVNFKMSNPGPDGNPVYVTEGTDMTAPFPDPNEPYEYVYIQMYNPSPIPLLPMPNTTETPSMQGFVNDYAQAIYTANLKRAAKGEPPLDTDPGVIMNCFAPSSLPVINGLAAAYAVCDNWLSSVPTQTFPNRSFIHAATSSGNVYNTWKTGEAAWDVGVFINDTETIYNRLETKPVSWRVYYGGPLLLCNTLITQKKLWEYVLTDHFSPFSIPGLVHRHTFFDDLKNGDLPSYSFIEPNMICSSKYGAENDMHPAYAIVEHGSPTNVLYGDTLINEIYTALLESDYWDNTLLVITFDEHGGCFDHMPTPPPETVSPDGKTIPYTNGRNGGSNFDFKRFGVRVPAVLVSPWIKAGTICHTQFDHTSVLKTVSNKWFDGQESLTARDARANCIGEVLTSMRRTDKPTFTPVPPPPFNGCADQALSPLQRDMMAASHLFTSRYTNRLIDLSAADTTEKAVAAVESIEKDFVSDNSC